MRALNFGNSGDELYLLSKEVIKKSHYLQEKSSIFLLFTPKIDVNFFFGAPGEVHQNTPTFIFWTSPLGQWGRGFSVLSTPHAGSSFTLLNDPTNRIFWRPLLETKPPAPLASFLAAAHARIIAAEGSAALSRGSRGPRERAKVLLSPPIYPLLLHALHHSSVSASSPLSPRETHHKSYTSRIKHTGTRAPGTPSFAMGGEKKFIFENRSFFRSL